MNEEERYTIGELARLAGVTPRTIRYYTSEGLLPPSETRGRYASYGRGHLRRLEQIAQLKASYLPLGVIRERLGGAGAAPEGPPPAAMGGLPAVERRPPAGLRPGMAEAPAAYSARQDPQLSAGEGRPRLDEAGDPFRLTPALPLGRVEFFPADPEPAEGDEGEPSKDGREPAPELWRHFVVAPWVEVRLREPASPHRRRLIEELVAALRDRLASEEEA